MFKKFSILALGAMLIGSTPVKAASESQWNGKDLALITLAAFSAYKDSWFQGGSDKKTIAGLAPKLIPLMAWNVFEPNHKLSLRGAVNTLRGANQLKGDSIDQWVSRGACLASILFALDTANNVRHWANSFDTSAKVTPKAE